MIDAPRKPTTPLHSRRRLALIVLILVVILPIVVLSLQYPKLVSAAKRQGDLAMLVEAASSDANARAAKPWRFWYLTWRSDTPSWPVATFLTAEVYRLRGDLGKARKMYRELVVWAAADPYHDKLGGAGLVAAALLRWGQMVDLSSRSGAKDAERLLLIGPPLLEARLVSGMFTTDPIAVGLPQLEGEIRRLFAVVAWRMGRKEEAGNLFFSYLKVGTTSGHSRQEEEILSYLVKEKGVAPEKVALYRGERLVVLGRYGAAALELAAAAKSKDLQVKVEADLNREKLRRIVLRHEPLKLCADSEAVALLTPAIQFATDPDVSQEASMLLATTYVREGCGALYDFQGFKKAMTRLLKEHPRGERADDALNRLAKEYLNLYWQHGNEDDFKKSMQYYDELAQFPGDNHYRDSMRFMPALGHYSHPRSLKKSLSLLQQLEKERPSGPLHMACLFWSGRVAEELGDVDSARAYFGHAMEEGPFNYYGIRARMHLNEGGDARRRLDLDHETLAELSSLAQAGAAVSTQLTGKAPYHLRLKDAVPAIYRSALERYYQTRRTFSRKRLCDMDMQELEASGALMPVLLLLSYRLDAKAAAAAPMTAANRIEVAGYIGAQTNDWSAAMDILIEGKSLLGGRALAKEPGWLAVAYPPAFKKSLLKASSEYGLQPELLYSIVRTESAFNPAAWSEAGAVGLFQFLPSTLEQLDSEWHFLAQKDPASLNLYLLDHRKCTSLGGRWMRKLLDKHDGNILFVLIEHNAGEESLEYWKQMWTKRRRLDDYEFMVETIRFEETRSFARGLLTDYWISTALHLF
ncbi:transglycosylase SLT domain-containing protein [Geomonas paludis]|uniref:Transglycosylase SLT domain-containing protein n=1 Tax=Geomonas paludis TaxID=2740185 RepID=A0ABY4LK02_9BACT|nr:transglycosylase SLT domain-containing protein [Geomonas paludis]UPU37330.1 transglycosylase SLT domain-containing protein [Geomonas paludis]